VRSSAKSRHSTRSNDDVAGIEEIGLSAPHHRSKQQVLRSETVVDDRTVHVIGKLNGQVANRGTRIVSEDGTAVET
jgi:hypothetical protein